VLSTRLAAQLENWHSLVSAVVFIPHENSLSLRDGETMPTRAVKEITQRLCEKLGGAAGAPPSIEACAPLFRLDMHLVFADAADQRHVVCDTTSYRNSDGVGCRW